MHGITIKSFFRHSNAVVPKMAAAIEACPLGNEYPLAVTTGCICGKRIHGRSSQTVAFSVSIPIETVMRFKITKAPRFLETHQ